MKMWVCVTYSVHVSYCINVFQQWHPFWCIDFYYRMCQSLATNALKRLMDRLEERILQTDQLKNPSKCLQHRVDYTHSDSISTDPHTNNSALTQNADWWEVCCGSKIYLRFWPISIKALLPVWGFGLTHLWTSEHPWCPIKGVLINFHCRLFVRIFFRSTSMAFLSFIVYVFI